MEKEKVKVDIFKNVIRIKLGTRCDCGKYQGIRYKGIICDRCGIEVRLNRTIKIDRRIWALAEFWKL